MFILLKYLQKNMIWTVPLFMLAGFAAGIFLEDPSFLKGWVMPLTFLMVYPMMVTMQFRQILVGGDSKLQIATQLINFALIPFIAFGLGGLFFPTSPYFALGFLLVALLPTSGMTISWTGMSKGNMEAAVKMTVFGLLIGSLATPFYIKWLMGTMVSIPLMNIVAQIGVIVLLPMLMGYLSQRILIRIFGQKSFKERIKTKFPPLSTLGVLLMVFVAMALKAKSIMADPVAFVKLIPPLLLLYIVNLTISTLVARKYFNRKDGLALVFGTVLRNLSIALAIAMTSFGSEGSAIALVIALGYIVQIQISAWYVKLAPRIFGPSEEPFSSTQPEKRVRTGT